VTKISIGITTRDRPASLRACLRSIAATLGSDHDVLVFDDASEVPVAVQLAGEPGMPPLRILRDQRKPGYIAGRNTLVREARHEFVLLLDDDTLLLDAAAAGQAVDVMERDPAVGAIAFAQAERDGSPWPEGMQPGRGRAPVAVASYVGFAHLLRRSLFLAQGGYRESFVFYGEEKDYCLRLLASGQRVVYLPGALIAHVPDAAGRDPRRYVRYVIRNDCLAALYNDPWPLAIVGMPVRFLRYQRMSARIPGGDAGGFRWLIGELYRALPGVIADRRAVSWTTVRAWRRLRGGQPYPAPSGDA
jgi:N-acetylglucosaminyl-diphospho-decaprenol L-rhamnosyltransferase